MKKNLLIILHTLSVLLFAAGLSILYLGSPYGYGVSWVNDKKFEDSPGFSAMVDEDIEKLLSYARLADAFETDGEPDMDNIVVDAEQNGDYISYTLRELISTAQKYGYYFNPKTHDVTTVSSSGQAPAGDGSLRVTYKYYEPDYFENLPYDPGQGITTLKDLSEEVVDKLAEYYDFRDTYISNPSNLSFSLRYSDAFGDPSSYTNTTVSLRELREDQKYIYVSGSEADADSNIEPVPEKALTFLALTPDEDADPSENFLFVSVNTAYPYNDAYKAASEDFAGDIYMAYFAMALLAAGILMAAVTFIPLVRYDLSVKKEELELSASDKLPLGIYLLLTAALYIILRVVGDQTALRVSHVLFPMDQWEYWRRLIHAMILYGVAILVLLALLRRYKSGTLWQNSLTAKGLQKLSDYFSNARISAALILTYGSFTVFNIALAGAFVFMLVKGGDARHETAATVMLVLLIVTDAVVFSVLFNRAKASQRFDSAIDSLSSGDIGHMIELEGLKGKELSTAQKINHISTGLSQAINEQVKSERLKADLITNVSHDLKTPLTSIINYVDLIKREHIDNEKINSYIEILDNKSKRLKTLTEDLVEVSKASSGNLKLDIAPIDLVELVLQTNAEFEDKFSDASLELLCTVPDEPAVIEADGRRLWRVLENLYNNAAKYALKGTRVYVDVVISEGKVTFTIKNISAAKLNISPDELTERFVRGDVSRTTEGSGLGLSIAQSLTKLQGGEFTIEIDGDLYKANVSFPLRKEPEASEVPADDEVSKEDD